MNEEMFLEAWKKAILLQHPHIWAYFGDGKLDREKIVATVDKDDLRPDKDKIKSGLEFLSGGERLYLVSLYSFYCYDDANTLCEPYDISYPTVGRLANYFQGSEQWDVLKELMEYFPGW